MILSLSVYLCSESFYSDLSQCVHCMAVSLAQSPDVLREELVVQPLIIPEQRVGHVLLVGGDARVDTGAVQTSEQVLNIQKRSVERFMFF